MKTIKGDLILERDTEFGEDLKVEGNIVCKDGRYSLKVDGNIHAGNIDAWNIVALDIDAWNIIFCESVKVTKGKIKSRAVIRKRSELEQKEWESD